MESSGIWALKSESQFETFFRIFFQLFSQTKNDSKVIF